MQVGEWQQAVMLLNALTDKYPKALSDIFKLFYVFFENNFVNVEN